MRPEPTFVNPKAHVLVFESHCPSSLLCHPGVTPTPIIHSFLKRNLKFFLGGGLFFCLFVFFIIIWQLHTVLRGNQGAQDENPAHGLA